MDHRRLIRRRAASRALRLIVLLLVAASPVLAEAQAAGPGVPTVDFRYSFVPFDRSCSDLADVEIEPAWVDELTRKVGTFQEYWDREGPRLLETVVGITGKPFRQREMIATMTLCRIRSMSLPLLLNMRRYLDSTREEPPEPMFMFGALVFHELLHTYVVDQLDASVLADEKYADEPGSVLSHLHLLSLMKATYLELGREEELAAIVARDSGLGKIYARAWEIVEKIEGHQAFVAEIAR